MVTNTSILTNKNKNFEIRQMYYSQNSLVNGKNLSNLYSFVSYADVAETDIYSCLVKETKITHKCEINAGSQTIQLLNIGSLSDFFLGQKVSIPISHQNSKTPVYAKQAVIIGLVPELMEIIVDQTATRGYLGEISFIGFNQTDLITLSDKSDDGTSISAEDKYYAKYLAEITVNPSTSLLLKNATVDAGSNKITLGSMVSLLGYQYAPLSITNNKNENIFPDGTEIIELNNSIITLSENSIKSHNIGNADGNLIIKNMDVLVYERDIIDYDPSTQTIRVDYPFDDSPEITAKSKIRIYSNNAKKPLFPLDSDNYIKSIHKNMIYIKKISTSDISPVILRRNWIKNNVYDYYDIDKNMHEKNIQYRPPDTFNTDTFKFFDNGAVVQLNAVSLHSEPDARIDLNVQVTPKYKFYVMNEYFQVFKCLWNNNKAKSTDEPIFFPGNYDDATNVISTSDGYKWKYLYTIGSNLYKFINSKYIPVPVLENVDPLVTYGGGNIEAIYLKNGGSGYTSADTIIISGDGENAEAELVISKGKIDRIKITKSGKDYTWANCIINSKEGKGAEVGVIISPIGGSGYNLLSELGCDKIMISSEYVGDYDVNLPLGMKILQYGLISNPKIRVYNGIDDASAENYVTCCVLKLGENTSVNSFEPGDTVFQKKGSEKIFEATCAYYDSSTYLLYLVNCIGTPTKNKTIASNNSVSSKVTSIDRAISKILPFSGDIIYIQNTEELNRDKNTSEFFKLILTY